MALDLADHVFRILENQQALHEFLGEHDWGFSMDDGTLSFADGSGREIASCPVQILGSQSDYDGTWLWGWANEQSGIPDGLLRAIGQVRAMAEEEGNELFLDPSPIETEGDNSGPELAIISAGAAGLFTYYACRYDGGCLFVGLDSAPEGVHVGRDAPRAARVMQAGISALDFDHRRAAIAYLGEPTSRDGGSLAWTLGPSTLEVDFDPMGRIAELRMALAPRSSP